jgi:hypothetical protein
MAPASVLPRVPGLGPDRVTQAQPSGRLAVLRGSVTARRATGSLSKYRHLAQLADPLRAGRRQCQAASESCWQPECQGRRDRPGSADSGGRAAAARPGKPLSRRLRLIRSVTVTVVGSVPLLESECQ